MQRRAFLLTLAGVAGTLVLPRRVGLLTVSPSIARARLGPDSLGPWQQGGCQYWSMQFTTDARAGDLVWDVVDPTRLMGLCVTPTVRAGNYAVVQTYGPARVQFTQLADISATLRP